MIGKTPWWKQPMLAFDLETTGVNVRQDRIVTASGAMLMPGATRWNTEVHNWLVNPGVPIPEQAAKIHGVTDEMARDGVPTAQALPQIVGKLADAQLAGFPIVGMNLPYDLSLLHFECLRYGVQTVEERIGRPYRPVLDCYVLDKQVDPRRRGPRKLDYLCSHYGAKLDGAHQSAHDAIAAARVVYQIARRYPQIGNTDLGTLHDSQVRWRAEQSTSLQTYLRREKPDTVVDPCWPRCVCPPPMVQETLL